MSFSNHINEEDTRLIEYFAPIDKNTRPQNIHFIEMFRDKIEGIIIRYKTETRAREIPLDTLISEMIDIGYDKYDNDKVGQILKLMTYQALTKVRGLIKTYR